MKALSLQKDDSGLQHVLRDLTQRIETLMDDAQSRARWKCSGWSRKRDPARHSWRSGSRKKPAKKAHCSPFARAWGRLIRACRGIQQRLTEAQVTVQGSPYNT